MSGKVLAEQYGHAVYLDHAVTTEIYIHADQLQLYRVIMNILTNATNYTPANGRIDIRLHVHDEQAVVEVTDTGLGISPEDLPHIFERFYRIDSARNRDQGGTGLGLAIVKAIITAHDGEISVDSTVGKGTTFSVSLPLNGPAEKKHSD